MLDEEIKSLKERCNELITSIEQKQEELDQINAYIETLIQQKESINEKFTQKEAVHTNESNSHETDAYTRLMEAIQLLSKQLEEIHEPEQVPRKKTPKERIWEGFRDAIRKAWKFLLMLAGTIMLSLIVTILLNEHLRNMMMEILKECLK